MALDERQRSVIRIVVSTLLLDLFAFTLPLPLFPRLIAHFQSAERLGARRTTLSRTLDVVRAFRGRLTGSAAPSERVDTVLLGGLLGSLFSALQFVVGPIIGRLADRNGRRSVLLASMAAFIWARATNFDAYLASRIIGGLSEGNVQISLVIISDVVPPEQRKSALALVGLAFSLAFTLGPPVGAFLAKHPLEWGTVNVYAIPAALTFVLLYIETIILAAFLPETGRLDAPAMPAKAEKTGKLRRLELLHFAFLLVFSGCEFTLTFLAYDLLSYTNAQNGALLGTIGLLSALTQGGFVRRTKLGSGSLAQSGMLSCAIGLAVLATLPQTPSSTTLYAAGVLLAYTSGTVVNGLTALASLEAPEATRGATMGHFRSAGQLGRALGPLIATSVYWSKGPAITYTSAAAAMALVTVLSGRLDPPKSIVKAKAA